MVTKSKRLRLRRILCGPPARISTSKGQKNLRPSWKSVNWELSLCCMLQILRGRLIRLKVFPNDRFKRCTTCLHLGLTDQPVPPTTVFSKPILDPVPEFVTTGPFRTFIGSAIAAIQFPRTGHPTAGCSIALQTKVGAAGRIHHFLRLRQSLL